MNKILFINACIRPNSRTYLLAQHVLKKLSGTVDELKLEQENLLPLDRAGLDTRNRLSSLQDFSSPIFQYAKQFAEADEIVIAAPYWDLAFPAILRIYLEQVTVTGLVFTYSPEGEPIGLCKAKRIIYVTTAGGPIETSNFGYEHVKALAETFYGIQNILFFKAENLDIKGGDTEKILQQAISRIENSEI